MPASAEQILTSLRDIPVPISKFPYWTVLYRPVDYVEERIPSLSECERLIEKTKVRLRGWDFPHLSNRNDESNGRASGTNWFGSWADFMGSIEYWRLYQSGQFVFVGAVREATERGWRVKFEEQTKGHLKPIMPDFDPSKVPGFISLVNLVYNFTEYFEFATRICQADVYQGEVEIGIGLHGAKDYLLTAENSRSWRLHCPVSSNDLFKSWTISSKSLLEGSAGHSLKALEWYCERFGWLNPNLDALKADQQKLLSGRL